MDPIDHLDLVVSDIERSLGWYRSLLLPMGYVRTSEIEGERGERVVAVFFYDPDGIKLEILHRPRERDLARRVQELEERLAKLES